MLAAYISMEDAGWAQEVATAVGGGALIKASAQEKLDPYDISVYLRHGLFDQKTLAAVY